MDTSKCVHALRQFFWASRNALDLDYIPGNWGSLEKRGVATLGNNDVVTLRQETLGEIVGDPKFKESEVRMLGTLYGDFDEILATEVILLQALTAKSAPLILVK